MTSAASTTTSSNTINSWSPFQIQSIPHYLTTADATEALLKELQRGTSYYKELSLPADATIGIEVLEDSESDSDETSSNATSTSESSSCSINSGDTDNKFDTLYKTEMCGSFSTTGSCPYKSKCKFAHGSHELRVVKRHPKYKSTPCRNFTETGKCPYGDRCCFLHKKN